VNRPRGGRVLVIGLGNRIRGDDGAGPRVAELVAERAPELEAIAWEREPTDLLTLWDDAALVVLVDAVAGARPGSWHRLELGEGPLSRRPGPTASTHVLTLAEVIELGRELARMPARLVIFGVEAAGFEAGAGLSPAVAAALDPLADAVLAEVETFAHG
jgi:hydrogenase maturation protease